MNAGSKNPNVQCSFCGGMNEANSVYCIHCGNSLAGEGRKKTDCSTLRHGSLVREFKVIRLVGEGGMGQVYEAVHSMTGARVAMKRMSPTLSSDEGVRRRFIEEARVMTLLDHPSTVGINQFFVEDGRFFLVMKFVDGHGADALVDDYRAKGRFMPVRQAVAIAVQTASALNYMHSINTEQEVVGEDGGAVVRKIRGVIHRDVKPANIMIDKAGGAYLTDFGIAKAVGREKMTKVGGVVGTFEYMSPEQVQGEESIGPACDQYSLAVTLFQLLTGRVPFEQRTDGGFDAMEGHVHKIPPAPSSFRPEIPGALDAVLKRALAKNPVDRFPDCASFGQALSDSLEGETSEVEDGPTRKPLGLYAGIGVGVVAVAALIISFGVGLGGKPGEESSSENIRTPTKRPSSVIEKAPSSGPKRKPAKSETEVRREVEKVKATVPDKEPADEALVVRTEADKEVCLADCSGKGCGPDGCGGSCGECPEERFCRGGDCLCRWDECKRECCPEGEMCTDEGCCKPNCRNKECGDNGCGWNCGTCPSGRRCANGRCASPSVEQLYVSASASDWNYMDTRKRDRYAPARLLDDSLSTAWCKEGGIGSWVKLSASGRKSLHKLRIRNGYQKVKADRFGDRFQHNSRVASATLSFSNGPSKDVWLDDSKAWQEFDLGGVRSSYVRLKVGSAHWGSDTSICISEMELYGVD